MSDIIPCVGSFLISVGASREIYQGAGRMLFFNEKKCCCFTKSPRTTTTKQGISSNGQLVGWCLPLECVTLITSNSKRL